MGSHLTAHLGPNRSSGNPATQVTILLLPSPLVAPPHLVPKQGVPYLGELQLVYLVKPNPHLSVPHPHQLLEILCLLLEHLLLRHLVEHLLLLLLEHPVRLLLVRSLLLEHLGRVLLKQVHLEAQLNLHNLHLGAICLVPLHHFSLHLAVIVPQPLVQ